MKASITYLLLLFVSFTYGQNQHKTVSGKVTAIDENNGFQPVYGANVYWDGTTIGTSTNVSGEFTMETISGNKILVISYIGYLNDSVDVTDKDFIIVELKNGMDLSELDVVHRNKSMNVSYSNPVKVEEFGEKELLKAACCNLSESFETNPGIDVSFTDAVTGARQIQMLGLAGPYTQITRENMPDIRGLSAIYGLTYTPGPWIESIQLIKGAGSVANGFESIAGQINVELQKPESADKLYLNLYANAMGRLEANVNLAHKFKNWSTALLLHGSLNNIKWDKNNDGFLDTPLKRNFIGLNRWKYFGANGLVMQFGIKGVVSDNQGGQVDFNPDSDALTTTNWGMRMKVNRIEGWAKIGKVFLESPWKSYGLQLSAVDHNQDSYFGLNEYNASQTSFYANFLYQSIIGSSIHQFRTGASFQYDYYIEDIFKKQYIRNEAVPGVYFEYTYSPSEKFNVVAGLRYDHHNIYGSFLTPRLHLRYAISENTILRMSGGRGQRTASIFSENIGLLASSRELIVMGDSTDKPYGLNAEVAYNYGVNLTQNFRLGYRDGSIGVDFYKTQFVNQIVVDIDHSPQQAMFYNLDGKSYSNSLQIQIDYEVIKRLDMRIAFRWYDVKTTYSGRLLEKPLISSNRAFINLGYQSRNHWTFDLTLNWQGEKRIPFTESNPPDYQLEERSPDFFLINAQISKSWKEIFDVYVGVENLFDFKQESPILSADKPFSPYFDSSLIWGPVFGRNIYVGFRFKIK